LLIEGKGEVATIFNLLEYPPAINFLKEIIFPINEDYLRALEIIIKLRRIGKPLPLVDVLIAAIALRCNYKIITKDEHFLTIKEVEPLLKIEVVEQI